MGTLAGTVKDSSGNPAAKLIRLYNRNTGKLITAVTSGSNGAWSATVPSGEYYGIALDASLGNSNAEYMKLAMHLTGDSGATTFTDVCNNTVTNDSSTTLVTANTSVYAPLSGISSSGLFTTSSLYVPASSDFDFTGDFNIDVCFYCTSLNTYGTLLSAGLSSLNGYTAFLMIYGTGRFGIGQGSASNPVCATASGTIVAGRWYFGRITRTGTALAAYVYDYTAQTWYTGSATSSINYYFSNSYPVRIGRNMWDGSNGYFKGYMNDLQVLKGIGLGNPVTAPTTAFSWLSTAGNNALIYDNLVVA